MSEYPEHRPEDNGNNPQKQNGHRKLVALIAATAVAAGGLFGAQAIAESKTYRHLSVASESGGWHGGWHAGWRGRHHGGFADMSDEEVEEKLTRMVRHVSIEIDATQEQEDRLIELFTAAAKEIRPLRAEMRDSRRQLRELLTSETIDREALEAMRSERLADFERMSKSLVNTLADAAEVLTPEQRILLEERVREFRSRHRGWDRD